MCACVCVCVCMCVCMCVCVCVCTCMCVCVCVYYNNIWDSSPFWIVFQVFFKKFFSFSVNAKELLSNGP